MEGSEGFLTKAFSEITPLLLNCRAPSPTQAQRTLTQHNAGTIAGEEEGQYACAFELALLSCPQDQNKDVGAKIETSLHTPPLARPSHKSKHTRSGAGVYTCIS